MDNASRFMKNAIPNMSLPVASSGRLKVLVVDDHTYFRESLVSFLGEFPSIETVGTAGDGEEAVRMVKRFRPQLVIMDIQMPLMDGLQACEEIKKDSPGTRVVLYTMHSPEAYDDAALKRADSCVPKDRLFDELPGIVEKEATE